jgi:hypothetical protein
MFCKDCDFRKDEYCTHDKIMEDHGYDELVDQLIYDYNEGGGFKVGPLFGCVHFRAASNDKFEPIRE